MTAEEWALAASAFFAGIGSGLLGMLSTIMRPMLQAMDGPDFRNFMGAFLRFAEKGSGRVFNFAWSLGMGIGPPIVALVLLWDDPSSTSFVLTAIGLGVVIVGIYIVANVWKEPHYKVILAWGIPRPCRRTGRRDGGATSRSTGSNSRRPGRRSPSTWLLWPSSRRLRSPQAVERALAPTDGHAAEAPADSMLA